MNSLKSDGRHEGRSQPLCFNRLQLFASCYKYKPWNIQRGVQCACSAFECAICVVIIYMHQTWQQNRLTHSDTLADATHRDFAGAGECERDRHGEQHTRTHTPAAI